MPSAGVRYVCGYNRREWKEVAYPVAFGLGGPVSTVERQGGPGAQGTILAPGSGNAFSPVWGTGMEGPQSEHVPEYAPSGALLTRSCPMGSMARPVPSPLARA